MATLYRFVLRLDLRGKWRWSFYGPGGHHLAVSGESYATESECRDAIEVIAGRTQHADIRVLKAVS